MSSSIVLGIESSCDETSAGVLLGDSDLLGHIVLSQDQHEVFGGVVPELAARAHLAVIDDVAQRALDQADVAMSDLSAIGVTAGPGLIGPLLVGMCWAKSLSFALDVPLVPVHHMEAHLFAPSLEDPTAAPPFVALLVSGGHTLLVHAPEWGTYRILGRTRDDAAGEAFDKVAKLLGLPYPGGPQLERLATRGDPAAFGFPRPMLRSNQKEGHADFFDFSFSGLKTAVVAEVRRLEDVGMLNERRSDLAASFQAAVVDTLVSKTMRAVESTGCERVLLGGGVSANGRLREEMGRRLGETGTLLTASPRLSLDNGAMVARAAAFRLARGDVADPWVTADASLPFPGVVDASTPTG